jgi:hypothetical protein
MKRLHITGCPRSGTTLLMELVRTCFDNDGHCEHELSIFAPLAASGELYISKQPSDIKQLRHIFYRDEQLFIVYLVRDPRAVITSKHRERSGQYFCNYRVWQECENAAQRYRGHPRFAYLRYEDLVEDPDAIQAQLQAQFAFLHKKHDFSEFHRFAQPAAAALQAMSGLREIDRHSLAKWREQLPRIAEQYQRHPELADELVRLGYEPDKKWLQLLEGVTGVVYPCRYPERRPHLKEWEKAIRVYFKSRRYLRRR